VKARCVHVLGIPDGVLLRGWTRRRRFEPRERQERRKGGR